jgi:vacuolar-type H+-ATPase subunit I/STV1
VQGLLPPIFPSFRLALRSGETVWVAEGRVFVFWDFRLRCWRETDRRRVQAGDQVIWEMMTPVLYNADGAQARYDLQQLSKQMEDDYEEHTALKDEVTALKATVIQMETTVTQIEAAVAQGPVQQVTQVIRPPMTPHQEAIMKELQLVKQLEADHEARLRVLEDARLVMEQKVTTATAMLTGEVNSLRQSMILLVDSEKVKGEAMVEMFGERGRLDAILKELREDNVLLRKKQDTLTEVQRDLITQLKGWVTAENSAKKDALAVLQNMVQMLSGDSSPSSPSATQ